MYYVYVLISEGDKKWFYIGYSSNLKDRLKRHNSGKVKSTKNKKPFTLIYYEAFKSKADALVREKNLKTHQQRDILKERIKNSLTII